MKKVVLILFIFILFNGCQKDNPAPYTYNESTIYSDNSKTLFSEILLILKPYIVSAGQKKYIVSDSIVNVILKLDNDQWGTYSSFPMDTSLIVNYSLSNYLVSDSSVSYSIKIPYQPAKEVLTTAGEYSDLLNNTITLAPGFYFCSIESFEIKYQTGATKKVKPNISAAIEVKANTRSSFMGEFEVKVE